jgi:glycosyltransferase involved in cell wall biosynthesis
MPTVTVVIPVFNGKRYLVEALESVFAQTYRDCEVICVDDGSTDGSAECLEGYAGRVTVVRQPNSGQGAARNVGIERAAGRYVAFLDQDDRWYSSKLEREVRVLQERPEAVLVYSNSDRMDCEGRLLQVGATLAERATALASPLGRLIGEGLVLPSSMLVRREVLVRVGGFDPHLTGFEDFDLCARLKQHGLFVLLEEPGLSYRVHDGGFSRAGKVRVIQSRERFLHRMQVLYAGDRVKERIIHLMLSDCYSDWGMSEMRAGDCRAGRRWFLRSLSENPMKWRTYSRLLRTFLPRRSAEEGSIKET